MDADTARLVCLSQQCARFDVLPRLHHDASGRAIVLKHRYTQPFRHSKRLDRLVRGQVLAGRQMQSATE
jgi:hypothetical protein